MKIKVKEKFVDSISGKKIYANKAENTTNGLNIDDSISSLSSTIKTKQDKLTFAGENNTITAINNSAISGDITALIPTNYYPDNNPSGFITDNTFNTTTNYLSGAIDYVSANAKDIFPVYASYGRDITFDKTYNEIYSAINDNKLPIVYFTNYDNRVKCTYTFGGNEFNAPLYFTSNYITNPVLNEKALYSYTLELLSDNTVTLTQTILNETKLNSVYDTVNTNSASWGGRVGNYHLASATVTNTGTNFTITLSSNNSYVALDNSSVSGNQSLDFTIVPPPLEGNELLDCMVQFRPLGGQSTTEHKVNANGLIQVGLRKYTDLNFIKNGETAQIRLLGNTYCLL